jgi:hypothetical protein
MTFIDYPGHLIAGLLLAGFAALIFFAFRSEELLKAKLRRQRLLLTLLQCVAVAILLLILWNPSRSKVHETFARNSILAVFDTSESMSVVDDAQTAKLDKAISVFAENFRPSDLKGPEYKIFGFDRQAYYGGAVGLLRRWGSKTDLHGVLALLQKHDIAEESDPVNETHDANAKALDGPTKDKDTDKTNVAGAIIFTDGQADDKSIEAYLGLSRKDFQVVLVGVGARGQQRDIAIKSVRAPSRVTIDTAYQVHVVVTARGLKDEPVTVELLKDNCVIDSKQLDPGKFTPGKSGQLMSRPEHYEAVAEFTVAADTLGNHTLSARAKAVGKETNVANNQRSTVVQVIEEHRLKVLFYSQAVNFDIGKIRQALARDDKIELDLGLDVIRRLGLSEQAAQMCGYVRLPDSREGFHRYDIVVLGPCDLGHLTRLQIDGLYSFVVDRGGGLILLPGRENYGPAAWSGDKIVSLLPAIIDTDKPLNQTHNAGQIELTFEAAESKIINLSDLTDEQEPITAYYSIVNTKPAATTLAAISDAPVICVHRVGRGRVCLLNAAQLFLLYREDLEGGILYRLMSGLTSYLGQVTNAEAGVKLFAERASDQADKVKFSAYICDKSFAPVSGANVLVTIKDQVLSMDQVGRGYYAAELEGIEDENVVARAQAEINGTFLGETTVAVNLPAVANEMSNTELDEPFLQALAQKLNGKYLYADDLTKAAAQMFEARMQMGAVTRMTSIWPTWPLLLLSCLLLSVSWYLRRAIGLV